MAYDVTPAQHRSDASKMMSSVHGDMEMFYPRTLEDWFGVPDTTPDTPTTDPLVVKGPRLVEGHRCPYRGT